ncbi:SDR family NAD(P)-dependent oxidoreductase [Litoreibacter janthinus]|uniref:NAD(P)-dependent dehydrogenase, short-chain alcohol dehydrogenase family n=1 Tax=Litoreibacter janthinus TaxID=670154 RepID=A0A1I6IC38_9RHOB|nr:SDR family NAD(P)-dependent oxidoreductase [Litoreibacter janthinus]SFR64184.1 NAD(P)-dependent dehydrogenase, short-chain alcohol dehydrogenase family [Litoreibacter janthinus]
MEISGSLALVSGGGSGLGAATARLLTQKGARVAVLDFDLPRAQAVADEIGGCAVQADVSDAGAVDAAFDAAVDQLGGAPRIVVNCAGIAPAARIVGRESKLSIDVFERTLRVNLFGTYNVMSHAAVRMEKLELTNTGERGVVINTSSVAWQDGQVGQAAYAASKGAVAALCLPAAREFARNAIRVVAIAPGLFHTPMMEGLPDEVTQKITSDIQFPTRLGDPREFALMASQIVENPYLNGTTIRLDGAVRLPPR